MALATRWTPGSASHPSPRSIFRTLKSSSGQLRWVPEASPGATWQAGCGGVLGPGLGLKLRAPLDKGKEEAARPRAWAATCGRAASAETALPPLAPCPPEDSLGADMARMDSLLAELERRSGLEGLQQRLLTTLTAPPQYGAEAAPAHDERGTQEVSGGVAERESVPGQGAVSGGSSGGGGGTAGQGAAATWRDAAPPVRLVWRRGGAAAPGAAPARLEAEPAGTATWQKPHGQDQFHERFEYLASLGVDVLQAVARYPGLLSHPASAVRARLLFLESCGVPRPRAAKILAACPRLAALGVDSHLLPAVRFLRQEAGVEGRHLARTLYRCPALLTLGVAEQLRPALAFLREVGVRCPGKAVANNPAILALDVATRLRPKAAYLEGLGVAAGDARAMLARCPALFNASVEENLQPKVDFLLGEMGGDIGEAVRFPQYFGFNLRERIAPRFRFLAEQGRARGPLADMLKPSEEEFVRRFGGGGAEAGRKGSVPPVLPDMLQPHGGECLLVVRRPAAYRGPCVRGGTEAGRRR